MGNTSSVLLGTLWTAVFLATPAGLSGATLASPYLPTIPYNTMQLQQIAIAPSLPYDVLATADATITPATPPPTTLKHRSLTPASPTQSVRRFYAGKAAPQQLRIPAVDIDAPIEAVGVNKKGEMDVPHGLSKSVGWYKYGTVPGGPGSAVIDAHVFAAFARLKDVRSGDDIYVDMSDGSERHFVISAVQTFPLASLSPAQLFRSTSRADLNLVTCAGSLTHDKSTYDHRLIVYSTLVQG